MSTPSPRRIPRSSTCLRFLSAAAVAVQLLAGTARGQPTPAQTRPPGPSNGEQVTSELIASHLKSIDESKELGEAEKRELRQLYERALLELDKATKRSAEAAAFDQMIQSAPDQLRQVKQDLALLSAAPTVAPPKNADLAQLQQALSQAEDARSKAKDAAAQHAAEPKRRAARTKEIPGLLGAAREQLAGVGQQLLALAQQPQPSALSLAQRTLLEARRQSLEWETASLERETAAYEATGELLRQQRDLAATRLALAEEEAKRWREIVNQRAKLEAAQDTKRTRREAEQTIPALQPLANTTYGYAKSSEEAAKRVTQILRELEKVNQDLDELRTQSTRTRERVDAIGLTYAIGLLLRSERADLARRQLPYRAIQSRRSETRDTQLKLFELEDRRSEMANLEGLVELQMENLGPPADETERAEMELVVRDLLTKQRDQLDALIRNYTQWFQRLVDLDDAQQQLIREGERYADYIDERVFWIGSTSPLRPADLRVAAAAMLWTASPQHWSEVGDSLGLDVLTQPLLNLGACCVFGLLIYRQRSLRLALGRTGHLAMQSTLCRILPTSKALLLTILIAVLWPALLWYLGWRLAHSLNATEFVGAVAAGLTDTAAVFLPLEFFRQVCRANGLAEAHFGWPPQCLAVLRKNLKWLVPVVLPFVFIAATLQAQSNDRYHSSLGRLSFIAGMLALVVFAHRVLRPSGDFFRHLLAGRYDGWFYRMRHLWYACGTIAPIALAVLAGLGYYYTAHQLAVRARPTVYVPAGLAILGAILSRWVMVVRRKLAMDRARRRLAVAQNPAPTDAETPQGAGLPLPTEPEVDLAAVSQQTTRLIHSALVVAGILALWLIWVDALPALGMLDEVRLWPANGWIGGPVAAGGDTAGITLADLAWLVLIVTMAVIATKNIPGLLEIAIPQRIPLDAGARYAITTVSRYLVMVTGLVLACGVLGIRWSTVQWLVAAVSVGLGFGLQEIFANFVSGLIILFERPIRVGDIVTIDNVTGIVARIQIRATTVTNWDRKEFIVPNKEFITGRLLNWTLSNPVNRVVVNVGIAYGSNTELARETLLNIAREHPLILDDPSPIVTFEGFGDSTLSFVLRCFLPNLDHRLQVIHELHTAIHRGFAEAGIEIAFPQRDVHIRPKEQIAVDAGQDRRVPPPSYRRPEEPRLRRSVTPEL